MPADERIHMNVLVIAHGPEITPGWLTDAAQSRGDHLILLDLSQGDEVPERSWEKVIVLGGHMGAYEDDTYPWLREEKRLLRTELGAETPILGVCLGSQMIAEVIGGRARRAADTEIGFIEPERTDVGARDSVLATLSGSVLSWHHDTFDLPGGIDLLSSTARYPQAFRHGSALAVQFHPEVTPEMWKGWIQTAGPTELEGAGLEPEAFQERLEAESDRLRDQAVAFFGSWLDE